MSLPTYVSTYRGAQTSLFRPPVGRFARGAGSLSWPPTSCRHVVMLDQALRLTEGLLFESRQAERP
jgi:hypothetical protein